MPRDSGSKARMAILDVISTGRTRLSRRGTTSSGIAVDVSEKMHQISPTVNVQAVMQFVYSHYNHGGSDVMFGGGARWGITPHGNITPYFQVLAGLTHCCENNWFTFVAGGGADIKVSKTSRIKIRIEGNWVVIFEDPDHGFRFNAGVVIPFGKK